MRFVNTEDSLNKFAGNVTRLAKIGLGATRDIIGRRTKWQGSQVLGSTKVRRKGKINASGNLSKSLSYKVTPNEGGVVTTFMMNDYGIYIDQGRKPGGIKKGALTFNWAKSKGMRPRVFINGKMGGFAKNTDSARRGMMFMIGRKIRTFGYEKTEFFTEPFNKEMKTLTKQVEDALAKDIEISFNYGN
jgi:hypothetical protein